MLAACILLRAMAFVHIIYSSYAFRYVYRRDTTLRLPREERTDMTLYDLLALVRRNLKLVIAIPVIFVIAAVAWSLLTQMSYTATASFVTNGDLALAQGFADREAASRSNSEVRISCSSVSTSKQVIVSVTGPNPTVCIEEANTVVDETIKQYKNTNSNLTAIANETNYVTNNGMAVFKYAFVALLAGLFVAICLILLLDYIKAPVKSRRDAMEISHLPILDEIPSAEGGERLLANLHFRNGGRPSTVAIVPAGAASASPVAARELAGVLERSDVRVKLVKGSPHAKKFQVTVPSDAAIVVSCEPLAAGMGAAYIAHNADATIVCVCGWVDSKKQLALTVQELELAKANVVGVVFFPEAAKPKEPRDKK